MRSVGRDCLLKFIASKRRQQAVKAREVGVVFFAYVFFLALMIRGEAAMIISWLKTDLIYVSLAQTSKAKQLFLLEDVLNF